MTSRKLADRENFRKSLLASSNGSKSKLGVPTQLYLCIRIQHGQAALPSSMATPRVMSASSERSCDRFKTVRFFNSELMQR